MSIVDWIIWSAWVAVMTYCFTAGRLLWRNSRRKPEPVAEKTEDEKLIAIGEAMLAAPPRYSKKSITPRGVELLCKVWTMDDICGALGTQMIEKVGEPGGQCRFHYIPLLNEDGSLAGIRLEIHPLRRVK